MLLLCFSTGERRFAIDASKVIEVVPMVQMDGVPKAPEFIAGVMQYHGEAVPVVDLSMINLSRPSASLLSTRIMMVAYPTPNGGTHTLGIIAEHMSETVHRDPATFVSTGVGTGETSYLGRVYYDQDGMVQLIDIDSLLTQTAGGLLFNDTEEAVIEPAF